jgi:hypothetical protein
MATEDTAPIPLHAPTTRPGIRAVVALFVGGALLIASTFLNLANVPLPTDGGETRLAITAWSMDLGLGHSIQQYLGVVTLIVGVALIVVAAASLRAEFRWTRNASLIAGGLGVAAGLHLAAAGYSTGTLLAQLASASGEQISASIGPGAILALVGALAALLALAFPPRHELVPVPVEESVADEPVIMEIVEEDADKE